MCGSLRENSRAKLPMILPELRVKPLERPQTEVTNLRPNRRKSVLVTEYSVETCACNAGNNQFMRRERLFNGAAALGTYLWFIKGGLSKRRRDVRNGDVS